MRKIGIFSGDILFARMLMHELSLMWSPDELCVLVNDTVLACSTEKNDIMIVDLDGSWSDSLFYSSNVLGFTKETAAPQKATLDRCQEVFHRPFLIDDLKKSVSRIIGEPRTSQPMEDVSEKIEMSVVESDRSVRLGANKIRLSKNEFDVMALLLGNRGKLVSRDEIDRVIGEGSGNKCDVYICYLRSKLAEFTNENLIYTVRNKGYMIK